MCNPLNVSSWRLLEWLGMRCEGYPIWQDTFEYGLLDSEWRGVREGDTMNKKVSYRELEIIISKMQREFGQVRTSTEDAYTFLLLPMESNLLKVSRKSRITNGRRAMEAVHTCLLTVKGYIEQTQYEITAVLFQKTPKAL